MSTVAWTLGATTRVGELISCTDLTVTFQTLTTVWVDVPIGECRIT